MEISHWHLYVVVNCGLIIPILLAKPTSLNKVISEEELKNQELTTVAPISYISTGRTEERFSLNNAYSTNTRKPKRPKFLESIKIRNKKSAFKNKKYFHNKSPLKRKKLQLQERLHLQHERRNQSKKRDIYSNGKIDKKYIPLLRNLGLLFDNILHSESHDSTETNAKTLVKSKQITKGDDVECTCTRKSEFRGKKTNSSEKAAFVSKRRPKVTTEKTVKAETPTTTPYPTSTAHVSSFRPDKIISLLPTRNTIGIRRDHNGLSEGSRAALDASTKRDISRNHGNSEYNTRVRENWSSSTNNEKDTHSTSRDDSSSDGPRKGIQGNRRSSRRTVHGSETKKDESTEADNSPRYHRGNLNESKRENKHEIGKDKANNRRTIPELGKYISADQNNKNAVFVQSKEDYEENVISIAKHNTSSKQFTVEDGPVTTEVQEISPTNKAIITIKNLSEPMLLLQRAPKHFSPQVTIIDGYSVARDKNGQNKLSEKTIHYQSKT